MSTLDISRSATESTPWIKNPANLTYGKNASTPVHNFPCGEANRGQTRPQVKKLSHFYSRTGLKV